jgi:isoleucyl-tRNA synthetase
VSSTDLSVTTPAPEPDEPRYRALAPHIDLPANDHEVIGFWRDQDVFRRSLAATEGGPAWTFYEGPPTANGVPGTHHVEARVFKDVFPRFKTMTGHHVARMAGWDCHGLPVELAVERELGFTGKPDIEAYGIAPFNAKCRESVLRNVGEFEAMSERMGYWADYEHPYKTMDPAYVESVWWALKQIFDQGLLVEDYRVSPYCPRCGTGLSDHEVAQGYEDVVDPSVYVRFPLTSGPLAGSADLLIWTTTPWTLVSNVAVAVNPDVEYVAARLGTDVVVVARDLLARAVGEDAEVLASYTGRELERWTYRRPFDLVELGDDPTLVNYVVLADYVTVTDGTGLVHQAPAFGADDLIVTRGYGMPVINPIARNGHFNDDVPLVGGQFFKDADETLVADLRARGLLWRHVPYAHAYPHCWRCHTPLMYFALPSWYVRTTARRDALLRENEGTKWYPNTIKHGRYGDWLENNIDWALSRDRYWGTPLPVWRNDADESKVICVGSLTELGELTGSDLSALDPHRPFVDDVTFTVEGQDGTYRRVPQVIDAWFDSGSMPFAQFGAPHRNADLFDESYPADFICEAIDQTRGWFYTLMAIGTLVFDQSSYRTVLCLGHIVAEDGRKMSKHLGNILLPMPLMDEHGADALRWFMLASGSPWAPRRIGHKILDEIASKVLRTYWSIASFQSLYARAAGWSPAADSAFESDAALDAWARERTNQTVAAVTEAMTAFDTATTGALLSTYIDDLSNWYIRRSRRRFWDGEPAALQTLHECLRALTLLLAPLVPFITETVWRGLFVPFGEPDSVHLASWPTTIGSSETSLKLFRDMELVRRLVELGRAARAESGVKTRQPLARALVSAPGWETVPEALRREVADELNVVALESLHDADEIITVTVKPNFRALGRRFGNRTKEVAAALLRVDPASVAHDLHVSRPVDVVLDDGSHLELSAEEIIVNQSPSAGWTVASDGAETVALDLELSADLRRRGLVREIVRDIQEARKNAGFDVSDRIELHWQVGGGAEPAEAMTAHAEEVAAEVLATTFTHGRPADAPEVDVEGVIPPGAAATPDGWAVAVDADLGLVVWLRRARA